MKPHHTASSRTDCNDEPILFQDLGGRQVVADFSGGTLSTDGGALLLRQADHRLGLSRALAVCFDDQRDQRFVDHQLPELLGQRLKGLALGYEDLNDHQQLRRDPLLAVACDKTDPLGQDRLFTDNRGAALAAPATLNRLELSNNKRTRCHKLPHDPRKVEACLLRLGVRCLSKHAREIVVDLDAMGHLLHGTQEGRHFSAYYGDYCYLPLYAFVGDVPFWAQLRTSDRDAADGVVPTLEKILAAIRQRCKRARILLRGDSGFCREEILVWCERHGIYYYLGLAKNSVLIEQLQPALADARARCCLTGAETTRVFTEFAYQTQKTWSRPRRVIGKAEVLAAGDNPRFIVTNLPARGFQGERDRTRFTPQRLYEECYCARRRDGKRAQAADLGLGRRSAEHASPGQQSTAALAGHLCLSALGAGAGLGPGRDRTGPGDGGHRAVETLEPKNRSSPQIQLRRSWRCLPQLFVN